MLNITRNGKELRKRKERDDKKTRLSKKDASLTAQRLLSGNTS